MQCKLCRERGKTWNGDDPRCAFQDGEFSKDNWNCATMNELRDIASRLNTNFRDDAAAASIGCVPFEGDTHNGYVIMTWYKERGTTGNAVLMGDDEDPRPLTEKDALGAIAYGKSFFEEE